MAKYKLSRELKPTEVPAEANESLPEAISARRMSPDSKHVAGGAEHRAGVEEYEEVAMKRGAPPEPKDPPRGQKPSGGK